MSAEHLPPYRPPVEIFDEVILERREQLAKGRDATYDDARTPLAWLDCLRALVDPLEGLVVVGPGANWRQLWIKVAAIAVAVVEAEDRRARREEKG